MEKRLGALSKEWKMQWNHWVFSGLGFRVREVRETEFPVGTLEIKVYIGSLGIRV